VKTDSVPKHECIKVRRSFFYALIQPIRRALLMDNAVAFGTLTIEHPPEGSPGPKQVHIFTTTSETRAAQIVKFLESTCERVVTEEDGSHADTQRV
jgi:hypothetical protein